MVALDDWWRNLARDADQWGLDCWGDAGVWDENNGFEEICSETGERFHIRKIFIQTFHQCQKILIISPYENTTNLKKKRRITLNSWTELSFKISLTRPILCHESSLIFPFFFLLSP